MSAVGDDRVPTHPRMSSNRLEGADWMEAR